MKILSPISGNLSANIIESIQVDKVLELYKSELGIEVSPNFLGLKNIGLYKCSETDYKFYYPFQIAGDEKFYDDLKVQLPLKYNVPYYTKDKWEYGRALKQINTSDNVLEIGCGNGYFIERLKALNIKCSGLELNAGSVKYANEIGLDVHLSTIEEFAQKSDNTNRFDVVCTFQVLEHIYSVKSFLDACIKVLKPGGKLIIVVPYSKPFMFINDKFNTLNLPPHHMGLWNELVFLKLEKFFDIKVDSIEIEPLAKDGYDFLRFYEINKDIFIPKWIPFKNLLDKIYWKLLKNTHKLLPGKNIFVVFKKNG